MIWRWLVSSRLGRAVSAAMAFMATLGAAYLKGADTGGGATDDERLKRLQRLGQEWDAS
jgi:hypothetical protein